MPENVLPDYFLRGIKNSDYSSVSYSTNWLFVLELVDEEISVPVGGLF